MPFVFDNPNHHGSGFYFDDPSETFSGSGGGGDNGGVGGFNGDLGAPAAAGSIPYAMRQMASRLSFHSYLIQEAKGRWEQDQLNAAIVALGGSAMTPPVGAPDAAVGYTGTQTYLEFYKRLQRALVYPTPIDVVPAVQAALLARGWTL